MEGIPFALSLSKGERREGEVGVIPDVLRQAQQERREGKLEAVPFALSTSTSSVQACRRVIG